MPFKPDNFYAALRKTLFADGLSQGQVNGIDAILNAWGKYLPSADVRHIAYSLATTFHETAKTMQPIEEKGHGRGRAYGVPNGKWKKIYDGRGDVQLTWEKNYVHATQKLLEHGCIAAGVDLARNPDLAMKPEIAAPIMIFGMTEGWFTGKKLADYFNDAFNDPVNARRIINGTDKAQAIADYFKDFVDALKAAA